jgi:hypothetical protein
MKIYRLVGCALVMFVLLTGCDGPTGATTDPTSPGSPALGTAGSSDATPTAARPARPVLIPDASARRLIQDGDTPQGGGRESLSLARQLAVVTPPCATAAPASEALEVERNAIGTSFGFPAQQIYGHVSEVLTLYGPGGAAQYMSEVTAALATCATNTQTTRTIAARSFAGDESVLIFSTFMGGGSGQTPVPIPSSSYRAVIRADDVVMVLDVGPLESGLTQRETMDTMIDIAIKRAEK